MRERVAAWSARPIEAKVHTKQARKARAEHAVKCSLTPSKRTSKRHFYTTERERQFHENYKDTVQRFTQLQKRRLNKTKMESQSTKNGDRHFTERRRITEITMTQFHKHAPR